jgi:phage terminase large subunit-like protein
MPVRSRTYPHVALGETYAQDVVAGREPACRWVRLACERQLNDLERWRGKNQPYVFDAAAAERVCSIIERFPHIKGAWAQQRLKLELRPWQCFNIATVFGWKVAETAARRFRVAYTEVPRKNAKSTVTSALGNYLVACDGEEGAYVVSAANTRDQAKLVFTDAQIMARREPGFLAKFGVEVPAHVIAVPSTASKFEALSAEHSNLDGLNLHAALIDAINAIRAAAADPASDAALLDEARAMHRQAQFMWDFVSAENSTGFHNPEYALKILAESTNLARQAQMKAAQASGDPSLLETGTYYLNPPPEPAE